MKTFRFIFLLFMLSLLLFSCQAGNTPLSPGASSSPASSNAAPPSSSPSGPVESAPLSGEITIEDGAGNLCFRLLREAEGYSVKDNKAAVTGRIKIESDRIKVKDTTGRVIFKLKKKETGCKVLDDKDAEIFKIKGSNGDYKIKNASDSEVCRIKPRKDRLEISGTASATVRNEGAAIIIASSGNRVLYKVSGDIGRNEAAFLGIYEKEPLQRLGMMIYFKVMR